MAHYTLTHEAVAETFLHFNWSGVTYRPVIQHCETHSIGRRSKATRPGRHSHDVYHVVLYVQGQGRFWVGQGKETMKRGVLAMVPPGVSHEFQSSEPGHWDYHEVTFTLESRKGALADFGFSELLSAFCGVSGIDAPVVLRLAENQTCAMEAAFMKLLDFVQPCGRLSLFYSHLTLSEMLSLILQECLTTSPRERSPLESVRRLIEQRYTEKLSVQEMAAVAHLSRAYFLRSFKKAYGVSPVAYQHGIRIRAARVLLRSTELTCQQIADRVGYYDAYHFSRMYRKVTGYPPSRERVTEGKP